jgi:hypothetical protein
MIVYQVTITLQSAIEADWLDWMRRVHVPEVLNTGCFSRCSMAKALAPPGDEVTYVFCYESPSLEAYERYRQHFATTLQEAHTSRYAGRFHGSRLLLEEVSTLSVPPLNAP